MRWWVGKNDDVRLDYQMKLEDQWRISTLDRDRPYNAWGGSVPVALRFVVVCSISSVHPLFDCAFDVLSPSEHELKDPIAQSLTPVKSLARD